MRAIEELKQAMEVCELGALTLPDQVDALMDAARAILQEISTLTPPNEPLTLEQLREMDGKPIYVVGILEGHKPMTGWCVVDATGSKYDSALVPGIETFNWRFNVYEKEWLAYRRPPKGEKDT